MSVKKRKFWCAVFETVEKVVKNFQRKQLLAWKCRNCVLFHLSVRYSVQKFNFLCINFLLFFQRIQTRHQILRFWYPYRDYLKKNRYFLVILALFANFKTNARETAQKIEKPMCLWFHFACISGSGFLIFSIKVKVDVHNVYIGTLFCWIFSKRHQQLLVNLSLSGLPLLLWRSRWSPLLLCSFSWSFFSSSECPT